MTTKREGVTSFSGTARVWFATYEGDLIRTGDGGISWIRIPGTVVGLSGFNLADFVNEDRGWAINGVGELWHTTDGGWHWTRIAETQFGNEPSTEHLWDLKFVDKDRGWAASLSYAWRTKNAGDSWERFDPFSSANLQGQALSRCYFASATTGCVGAHAGVVSCTRDGGANWTALRPASEVPMMNVISFVDASTGWVYGYPDGLYRTDDGGWTWRYQGLRYQDTGVTVESLLFLTKNLGWVAGFGPDSDILENRGGVVLCTRNGGETWEAVKLPVPELRYTKVHFADEKMGWVFGLHDVYLTSDGGETWQKVSLPAGFESQ